MAKLEGKKIAAQLNLSWERNQRWFLFSGITGDLEKSLSQKIQSLGGKIVYPASDTFSPQCTHVVAQEFATTEKILGALAGGKWLVTAKYILESFNKNRWLKEERFELTDFNKVAAYHRQKKKLNGVGLYAGWRVLVLTESPTYSRKFKRILVAGGAEVALKDDISNIDFVITKKEMLEYAQKKVGSVLLVDVSYIKDTLLFRINPHDLVKYDLRHPQELKAFSKPAQSVSMTQSSHGGPESSDLSAASKRKYSLESCQLSKRPSGEASPNKRRKIHSQSQLPHLKQFQKPVSQKLMPIATQLIKLKECYVPLKRLNVNHITRVFESLKCKTTSGQLEKMLSSRKPLLKCKAGSFEQHEGEVVRPDHHTQRQLPEHETVSEQVVNNSVTPNNNGRPHKCYTTPSKQLQPISVGQGDECETTKGQHQQEAVTSEHPVYIVTKVHVMEAIVHFLRRNPNGVCSTSTLSIPRGSEKFPDVDSESSRGKSNPEKILDAPISCFTREHREMTMQEMNFFICCVDSSLYEQDMITLGIESLLLQVSSYLYPPPDIMGRLLRDFVLEAAFINVHANAMRVAYEVLKLHPPVTEKMRAYYITMLQNAMKPDDSGKYVMWKFIWNVIQRASYVEGDKESLASQNTALDKATKAIRLLEFIVLLLTEDVRHSSYGKAVQDLLTWQIFWGYSKNCSVTSPPVQQLLRLWMSKQATAPALKWHLAQLVSVLLEMMWKLSGHLIPINVLPHSLAGLRKEMEISLRGLSSQGCLEVIRSLHTPWAQAVVTFIIVQAMAQCPSKISLSCIMNLFNSSSEQMSDSASLPSESVKVSSSFSPPVKAQTPRNVNKRNSKGETRLLRACMKNDVEQLRHLLSDPSVDLNLCDHSGWTPLHEAALRGHDQCVELLLNHNSNKDSSSHTINIHAADNVDRWTPLHDAVMGNKLHTVKLLLDHGGEDLLKEKARDGKTAFDLASSQEMLDLLMLYRKEPIDDKTKKMCSILDKQRCHKELILTLANCYLEVSGNRYLASSVKKCIRKEMLKTNKSEKVDVPLRDTESKCQALHEQRKTKLTKLYVPQYLNLVEKRCSPSLNKFEKIAAFELYKWIKLDKDAYRKQSSHSILPVKIIGTENSFKTLCL